MVLLPPGEKPGEEENKAIRLRRVYRYEGFCRYWPKQHGFSLTEAGKSEAGEKEKISELTPAHFKQQM